MARELEIKKDTQFFVDMVEEATRALRLTLPGGVVIHTVDFLRQFVDAERFMVSVTRDRDGFRTGLTFDRGLPALATMLAQATAETEVHVRIHQFVRLGQQAVFNAGIGEGLIARRIPRYRSYATGMARLAYAEASVNARRLPDSHALSVQFEELAAFVGDVIRIIVRVLDRSLSDVDQMRLYTRWVKSGDHHLADRLRQAGLTLSTPTIN